MRATVGAAVAVTGALVLSGCQFNGLAGVSLPGGKAGGGVFGIGGGKVMHYTVYLSDALDLVPQSAVHVDDISVGSVAGISLSHGMAKVDLRVEPNVVVPANAHAVLRQTTLLGEKFVSLEVPAGATPSGRLPDNGQIMVGDTSQEVQLDDLFGALSDLLNGGGVQQLQTISVELSKTLTGREGQVRDLLTQLDTLTTNLDAHRADIERALDSLDALSTTLAKQRVVLTDALTKLAPGLQALDKERTDLVTLLGSLDNLGSTTKRVLAETQVNTLHDLSSLEPTLSRLQQVGSDIPASLELLVTFPFGDNVINAIPGDYTGLRATVNLDLRPGSANFLLGPNGPLCGSLPVTVPSVGIPTATTPKPPFCTTTLPSVGSPTTGSTTTSGSAKSSGPKATGSGTTKGSGASTPAPAPSSSPVTAVAPTTLPGTIGDLLKGALQ